MHGKNRLFSLFSQAGNLDFSSNNDIHELACFLFTKDHLVLFELPQDDMLPDLMQFFIGKRRKKRYISQNTIFGVLDVSNLQSRILSDRRPDLLFTFPARFFYCGAIVWYNLQVRA